MSVAFRCSIGPDMGQVLPLVVPTAEQWDVLSHGPVLGEERNSSVGSGCSANKLYGETPPCPRDRKMDKVNLRSNSSKRDLRSRLWAHRSDCQFLMCDVILARLRQALFNDPVFLRATVPPSFFVKHLSEARCAVWGHLVTT